MGKKQTCPAVRMKQKRAKKLAANLYRCIPAQIKRTHTGVFDHHGDELDFTLELLNDYRKIKSERLKELKDKYGKGSQRNPKHDKRPWYYLTKGVQYNYREKKYSSCTVISWFRRISEQGLAHKDTIFNKMTPKDFVLTNTKLEIKRWERSHPEPQKEIDGTKNAFYETEHKEWVENRSKIWNETLFKTYDKVTPGWREIARQKQIAEGARWNGMPIAA